MTRKPVAPRIARLTLTVMLVATIAAQIVFTWLGLTGEHVFNPEWHPHARYHAAWMVGFVVVLSAVGLWLLWRPGGDVPTAGRTVAVVGALLWTTEFFGFLVPGTSAGPVVGESNTVNLLGLDVHGNLLFAGLMVVLGVTGFVLVRPTDPSVVEQVPVGR